MSNEQLKNNESQQAPEQLDDAGQQERLKASIEREAAKAERDSSDTNVEQARQKIEQVAKSQEQTTVTDENQSSAPSSFIPLDRSGSFKQVMTDVRSKLSSNEQRFSKIVHQPAVEKISDVASKSVGRSSLLLGGFMATFIGSAVVYANARTNGYGVSNVTFLIVLFIAGALVGLALEIVYRTIKRYLNS